MATLQEFNNIYNEIGPKGLNKFVNGLIDQSKDFFNTRKYLIQNIMTLALAADAPSKLFLTKNRDFIKNTTGSSITITYNNHPFVFAANTTYCLAPGEVIFFLQKKVELNLTGLSRVLVAEFVATGVNTFLYW